MEPFQRIQHAINIAQNGSHDDIHKILSAKINEPDSNIVHSEEFHNATSRNPNLSEKNRLNLARTYIMNKPHYPLASTNGDTDDEGQVYSYMEPHDSKKIFKSKDSKDSITLTPMGSPIEDLGLSKLAKSPNKEIAHAAHDITAHYIDNNPANKGNGEQFTEDAVAPLAHMFNGEFDKGRKTHYHNIATYGDDYKNNVMYNYGK